MRLYSKDCLAALIVSWRVSSKFKTKELANIVAIRNVMCIGCCLFLRRDVLSSNVVPGLIIAI